MIPAVPMYFGGNAHLFGWYHAPAGPHRSCGIVLCPPLGHEYVCAHRAFRHLAERLAGAGFAVLRFDYPGTGDSAGTPSDDGLVQAWHDSVSAAADELRARSGARALSFVGLRMGASIAATTAARRGDVSSLVVWEPVTTGRAYVRQVTMLGRTGVDAARISADGTIEAAGFSISEATSNALSALRWTDVSSRPVPRVLVLTRNDIPCDGAIAAHLRQGDTAVDEATFPGYASFMTAPVKSTLPSVALDCITKWFLTAYPVVDDVAGEVRDAVPPGTSTRAAYPLRVSITGGDHTARITEQPVRFGEGLFGILSRPEQARPDKPIVITLNTGADHHIGPHRLYVSLARDWAVQGFAVLRVDLAGLGDSPARRGAAEGIAYPDSALDDVQAAIRYAAKEYDTKRVILVGICSGGYYAIHAAHAGAPIAGFISVNPPLYWEPGRALDDDPYWNAIESARVGRSLLSPEKWGRLVRGNVDVGDALGVVMRRVPTVASRLWTTVRGGGGASSVSGTDVAGLFPENVAARLVFSVDDPALLYFQNNVPMSAPLRKRAAFGIDIAEGADHTFMPIRYQKQLKELLTRRLMEM